MEPGGSVLSTISQSTLTPQTRILQSHWQHTIYGKSRRTTELPSIFHRGRIQSIYLLMPRTDVTTTNTNTALGRSAAFLERYESTCATPWGHRRFTVWLFHSSLLTYTPSSISIWRIDWVWQFGPFYAYATVRASLAKKEASFPIRHSHHLPLESFHILSTHSPS